MLSASIWRKRTLVIPSCSARSCAAVIISGAKSEEISVPVGAICSAARKPTSPVPAASSSTSWPGCSSSASTIHTETGIVDAAQLLGTRRPALGLLAPAGAALLAIGVGVAHVSSRRSSLPEGVRGSRVTSSNDFGTL